MTTLLMTATVFDDVTRIAYSFHFSDRVSGEQFSPIAQCEASVDAWAYLLRTLPEAHSFDAIRLSVIRRDGKRAESRCSGHRLTAESH